MSAYRTVVVGTDGSRSSLIAVERAGALAGACGARLVIVCAYLPSRSDEREARRARAEIGEEVRPVVGPAPAEQTVRAAAEAAVAAGAGAGDVDELAVVGSPVETLIDVVTRTQADLLVVGNRGMDGTKGRLVGSVPGDVTRRSSVDVLVVHTTD
ncbi:Nucleotide-binding universal stress protein, UspA family [Geodermatophilus pulveris]|uniref:Nucleotide-binding universal stress protein, UspA family n=1 Tax=Geodermatophilus pulveris TaxID=1564159 RepID=A0A239B8G1_9ACTN|nr:universal stress protein [Geodermatophilus pulveris]SNS03882.1 Nucleotide-binding universal stress protein, UspA family [Geodermatophilus pulveris]